MHINKERGTKELCMYVHEVSVHIWSALQASRPKKRFFVHPFCRANTDPPVTCRSALDQDIEYLIKIFFGNVRTKQMLETA